MSLALAAEFRPLSEEDADRALDRLTKRVTPGVVEPRRDDLLSACRRCFN